MYKLSATPKYAFNEEFVSKFNEEETSQQENGLHSFVKGWWRDETRFRVDLTHGIYSTSSCTTHIMYVAMLLCRLFGLKDVAHFRVGWVPILDKIENGETFDWAKLLSDNLVRNITIFKARKTKGEFASFYMSAYIMDVVCYKTPFPLMNWSWNPGSSQAIHFYHDKLWEENMKDSFYEISHNVIIPLHELIFGQAPLIFSLQMIKYLEKVADWFVEEYFSYIRVFGSQVSPHALPRFVSDKLVLREVAYQIATNSISKELRNNSKKQWPYYPVSIGQCSILDFGHSKVEAKDLEEINLADIELKMHDPLQIISKHCSEVGWKRVIHEESIFDNVYKGVQSYNEVLTRIQALPEQQQDEFLKFQAHRRSCLPRILQGMESESTINKEKQVHNGDNPIKNLSNPLNSELSTPTLNTMRDGRESSEKSTTGTKKGLQIKIGSSEDLIKDYVLFEKFLEL
jgi:hypothetical protein